MVKRFHHGGISRPRYVAPGDTRSPMLRLLQDCCTNKASGQIEVDYEAQFRTMFKAQRLGYLDNDCRLTDKGREFTKSPAGAEGTSW